MTETVQMGGRRSGKTEEARTRLIRAVRAACRERKIDDDTRKAMQQRIIGKASLSDMNPAEMTQLLNHINGGRRGSMGHRPHIGKIRALWWSVYWIGEIDEPGEDAMNAFVQRQTGLSALRFLDHRQAASVIEALKSWAARKGVNWPEAGESKGELAEATLERRAVLRAIGLDLCARKVIAGFYAPYVEAALRLNHPLERASTHELDTAIRLLGRMLRKAMGKS